MLSATNTTTMKHKLTLLMPLLLIFTLFLSLVASASTGAYTVPATDKKGVEEVTKAVASKGYDLKAGGELKGGKILYWSKNDVAFDGAAFDTLTSSAQKQLISDVYGNLEQQNISKKTTRDIQKTMETNSADASKMIIAVVLDDSAADMSGGYSLMSGALPLIKVFFGVCVYILVYALVGSTILDFIYMVVPLARNIGTGGNGGDKPAWISPDCYMAVKEAESGEKGGNMYLKYILKRSWTYILFVLGVTWLVLGNMGSFITSIMSLGDGFLNL